MEQSTNAIETVGLLIGSAQADTIYRDVSLQRAHDSTLVVMVFGVVGRDRRENTRGMNR
jgi:hypothetical protein